MPRAGDPNDRQAGGDPGLYFFANMATFIRERLPVAAVRSVPEIRLHQAGPSSRLSQLDALGLGNGASPYWAYPWAGGIALARYILDHPETVAGRSVLDLGAGSGLVGIAAAMAGAREVLAADADPNASVAMELNADLNQAQVTPIAGDVMSAPPPPVDLVLAGDVFYDPALAAEVTRFLDACLDAGADVLVGDIGRAFLPLHRLRRVADITVSDFGEGADKVAGVFVFERAD